MQSEKMDNAPILSEGRKRELVVFEISQWQNGIYINEILVNAARLLNDKPALEALQKELGESRKMVDEFKKEYFGLGGKDRSFDVPDDIKVRILEMEVVRRQEPVYMLEMRIQAAQAVRNKELAAKQTEELARIMGYHKALLREFKVVRRRVEKGSNLPGAHMKRSTTTR